MRLALISVLGAMVATACGDDGVSIGSSQDNYCSQIADVVCHNLYQCCTEATIEARLGVTEARTELQCRDDLVRSCQRADFDVRDSLKAGRITFDPNKLDACLEAVLAPDGVCSEVVTDYPWKDACDLKNAPWVGTVATDGQCFFNIDCAGAPDSFCGPDQKCHMKPTAGFPCAANGTCASAFYCGTNNTCAPKLALGAPCMYSPSFNQCDKSLFCDTKGTTVTTDDVCAATLPGGATCFQEDACNSNDCVGGTCMGQAFKICYSDTQCGGHCANSSASCTTSGECSNGYCSISTSIICNDDLDCGSTGGICTGFTVSCLPGDCVGDSLGICTSSIRTADYCTSYQNIPSP